ncbi:MAG TPA: M1 family metallopeptidase [Solirubrobacterales bacterium]|nr:M1 family metallopeptidase [Solirubrobacterales bacterium]
MARRRPICRASRLGALALFLAVTTASPAAASVAASETFFPRTGNPGYDVSHYAVSLAYRPAAGWLRGSALVRATASQRLSRFSLDLDGLRVTAVGVDGEPATFNRGRGKLKIVPSTAPRKGEEFTVVVHYQGHPRRVTDPDGSPEGWNRTPDGAVAVGEPVGTAGWLPCDNTLPDKASFSFELTVPARLRAVANGRLTSVSRHGGQRTFRWVESEPMTPYLALLDIGRGQLRRGTIDGLPAWTLVDPSLAARTAPVLARLPEVLRFERGLFGPYPYDAVGSVVDRADLGYALETQTRPIYAFVPDLPTVVHETAHQWFGDSVGLERWPDIWLNEGFATFAEWFYAERHGGPSVRQVFRRLYRTPATKKGFWDPPPGHPGRPANLFATSTYVRGGMALEALRLEVGTRTELKILRRWATEHRYGTAGIDQFQALAEEVSGQRLGRLFQRWLYQPGKPRR